MAQSRRKAIVWSNTDEDVWRANVSLVIALLVDLVTQ